MGDSPSPCGCGLGEVATLRILQHVVDGVGADNLTIVLTLAACEYGGMIAKSLVSWLIAFGANGASTFKGHRI